MVVLQASNLYRVKNVMCLRELYLILIIYFTHLFIFM